MPQIINLLSNAPTHIIEGIIKNNKNRMKTDEIKKQFINQLLPCIIIKKYGSIRNNNNEKTK